MGKDKWDAASGVCTGKACGCRKSDYCDTKQFGDLGDREECKGSNFNAAVQDAKEPQSNRIEARKLHHNAQQTMIIFI